MRKECYFCHRELEEGDDFDSVELIEKTCHDVDRLYMTFAIRCEECRDGVNATQDSVERISSVTHP